MTNGAPNVDDLAPLSFPLSPLRMVVLISGGGTTLRNLLEKIASGTLDAEIPLVISSNPNAKGLQIAAAANIPTLSLERKSFPSVEAYSDRMFAAIREQHPHVVVMGGFLKLVHIPADFEGRVLNIHPSLIPKHCGHKMYGHHVHESVLAAGDRESGCTVHFVDNQYDHGPIVLQKRVPVLPGDTPDSLAARVFQAECEAFPEALRMFAAGKLSAGWRR